MLIGPRDGLPDGSTVDQWGRHWRETQLLHYTVPIFVLSFSSPYFVFSNASFLSLFQSWFLLGLLHVVASKKMFLFHQNISARSYVFGQIVKKGFYFVIKIPSVEPAY